MYKCIAGIVHSYIAVPFPRHSNTYVITIFTCSNNDHIIFVRISHLRSKLSANIGLSHISKYAISCIYLSIMNTRNSTFNRICMNKTLPSGKNTNVFDGDPFSF